MKRQMASVLLALGLCGTVAACDESSSGADREADPPDGTGVGGSGSGGSAGRGGTSSTGGSSAGGASVGGGAGVSSAAGTGGEGAAGGSGSNGGGTAGTGSGGAGMSSGGAGASSGEAGTGTLTEAIVRSAGLACDKLSECAPTLLAWYYGDLASCRQKRETMFGWSTALADTGVTGPALERCYVDYSEGTCDEFFSRVAPVTCVFPGERANGAPCLSGAQCESGFCEGTDAECPVCANPPGEGDPCRNAGCGDNRVCTTGGLCMTPRGLGVSCSAANPCDAFLACRNGLCARQPSVQGAVCGSANGFPACDSRAALTCSDATNGTCVPLVAVGQGGSCAPLSESVPFCRAFGVCLGNVCVAGPGTGDACNPAEGLYCAPHQTCSASECTDLPDPTLCEE